MSTTRKTLLLNILLGAVTVLFLWGIGKNFTDKVGFSKKPAPRAEMRVLLKSLQLEDSAAKVRGKFRASQFTELKLNSVNPRLWWVNTPFEFGSKNWTLYLEFDANAKLAAIRLRTPDGTNIRPRDIHSLDRVRAGWISPMQPDWNPP